MAKRLTTEIFIERAKAKHGDKYDYSKVDYKKNNSSVEIICFKHGSFFQRPEHHMIGHGCPKCSRNYRWTTDEWIQEACRIHGNKYNYSKVEYKDSKEKVCIMCPEHGLFWQRPNDHLCGKGCIKCGVTASHQEEAVQKLINSKRRNGTFNVSVLQDYLRDNLFLVFENGDIECEYNKDERYPFCCDFYIKSRDLFIELNAFWTHGGHWFDEVNLGDIKQLSEWKEKSQESDFYKNAIKNWTIRDVKKREYSRKNNLNYVVLWNKQDIDEWIAEGCPIRKDWK